MHPQAQRQARRGQPGLQPGQGDTELVRHAGYKGAAQVLYRGEVCTGECMLFPFFSFFFFSFFFFSFFPPPLPLTLIKKRERERKFFARDIHSIRTNT